MNNDQYKAIEQALGEPFAIDFSEYVRKLRANLMAVSFISLAVVWANIGINENSSIFGFTLKGVTTSTLLWGLLIVCVYMLVHFIWCSFDNMQEWRLRSTGTFNLFGQLPGFRSGAEVDVPKDPRNSTLYFWWMEKAQIISNNLKKLDSVESNARAAILEAKQDPNTYGTVGNTLLQQLGELRNGLHTANQISTNPRIEISLKRFDECFQRLLSSQSLRWLLLELGLPILMGIAGGVSLVFRILHVVTPPLMACTPV